MYDEGSCSEAEPFALQVHGDSMEPEFTHGCVIVVDPAGVMTALSSGSYLLRVIAIFFAH